MLLTFEIPAPAHGCRPRRTPVTEASERLERITMARPRRLYSRSHFRPQRNHRRWQLSCIRLAKTAARLRLLQAGIQPQRNKALFCFDATIAPPPLDHLDPRRDCKSDSLGQRDRVRTEGGPVIAHSRCPNVQLGRIEKADQ